MAIPPATVATLCVALLDQTTVGNIWWLSILVGGFAWSFWPFVSLVCSKWTKVQALVEIAPAYFVEGGPLGDGCEKVVKVVSGSLLWGLSSTAIFPCSLGNLTSPALWIGVIFLSLATNGVLHLWSNIQKTRGDHHAIHDMVEASINRELSVDEHVRLTIYAFLNAFCEELEYRGLWLAEFKLLGRLTPLQANFAQAVCFGVAHYHGIPSGFVGIGLTFIYGLLMGFLFQLCDGLFLPIVAHTIADYFIFAVIARRQHKRE